MESCGTVLFKNESKSWRQFWESMGVKKKESSRSVCSHRCPTAELLCLCNRWCFEKIFSKVYHHNKYIITNKHSKFQGNFLLILFISCNWNIDINARYIRDAQLCDQLIITSLEKSAWASVKIVLLQLNLNKPDRMPTADLEHLLWCTADRTSSVVLTLNWIHANLCFVCLTATELRLS